MSSKFFRAYAHITQLAYRLADEDVTLQEFAQEFPELLLEREALAARRKRFEDEWGNQSPAESLNLTCSQYVAVKLLEKYYEGVIDPF